MTTDKKIALVTGANRGIGYEVCRELADVGMQVILTSRDAAKGEGAAEALRRESKDVSFHQLDVSDEGSVERLRQFVQAEYGRLDVLVNNAAVYLDEGVSVFDSEMAMFRTTMDINFYGALYMCRAFVPMMRERKYGRVVNVSSGSGALNEMDSITPAYSISKAALNALTRVVADQVKGYSDIKVNTMCPGWVQTDMGGKNATRTPAEGADTIIWLATLPSDGPTGLFFRDRQVIEW
ncbi:MAG: SDR family oxidoreductase [Chloroflexi bacterium]|nr:SDR family oxidoreductase [Chloroflexota bacterium]MCC6896608.1 SDR family oxidoreductase [Anaerolineae bacterium]